MSEQQMAKLLIMGAIAELPQEDQDKVKECAEKVREILREYGDHGLAALALVGATESVKE